MFYFWIFYGYILIWARILHAAPRSQVSVSSSAAASVKYPPPGSGGSPQAYISSLSSAKADPKIPVTVNDGAAEIQPKLTWAYVASDEAYGPEEWHKIAPQCAGVNQSPINIISEKAVLKPLENPLALTFGNEQVAGKLINNGKTIGFNVANPSVSMAGGVFGPDKYVLRQFHLHFGCNGKKGSEHTLNGEKFDGELHLVFQNAKYGDSKVAMQQKDGLAILAFFLMANPGADPNPAFQRIAAKLGSVQMPKQQVEMDGGLSLKNLVPALKEGIRNLRRFVYKGSLPTPPCYESVTWVIFKRPVNLVPERFVQLRGIYRGGMQPLCGNNRPLQKLNNRELFLFEPAPKPTTPKPTTRPSTTAGRSTTGAPATAAAGSTTGAPTGGGSSTGAPTGGGSSTGAPIGTGAPPAADAAPPPAEGDPPPPPDDAAPPADEVAAPPPEES